MLLWSQSYAGHGQDFMLWATILTQKNKLICHILDLDLIPAIFCGSRCHLKSIGKVREKAQSKLGLDVRAKVATESLNTNKDN